MKARMNQNIGTCKLCLAPGIQLQNSHFVPKFMYKLLLQTNGGNPNPVQITESADIQTSSQETAYLLCKDCEALLSKGGEEYVSRICWRAATNFALRSALQSARPIYKGGPNGTMKASLSSTIPELDVTKLTYFGASILWRASIWSSICPSLHQASLDAGLQESFRLFLKGENSFPKDTSLMLTVVDEPKAHEPEFGKVIVFPYKNMQGNIISYRFFLCGLAYQIDIDIKPDGKSREATFFPGNILCLAPWMDLGVVFDSTRLFRKEKTVSQAQRNKK